MFRRDGTVTRLRVSYNEPGHAHELTFSCFHRLAMLSKDRTREWLVESLERARKRLQFEIWAYVIMPEHVHLLILPCRPEYDMSKILKAVKQPVGQRAMRFLRREAPDWLNRLSVRVRSGRVEHHFWQEGGGYDRNIIDADTAWASVRYLHNNPVRRGLVRHPEEWPWSSARWYAGLDGVKLDMDDTPPPLSPPR
jgi:putative transposase